MFLYILYGSLFLTTEVEGSGNIPNAFFGLNKVVINKSRDHIKKAPNLGAFLMVFKIWISQP